MYALAYSNRGIAYFDVGQHERAIQDFDEAIRFDPMFVFAYFNRSVAFSYVGRDTEAQEDIERAVQLGADRRDLEEAVKQAKGQR